MKFWRWTLTLIGYLVFAVVVLGVMLWFQFPAETAKKKLEAELHTLTPGLHWNIGQVGLGLPAAVKMLNVKLFQGKQQERPLIVFDSLSLQPDLWGYLKKKEISASYTLDILQGTVKGHLTVGNKNTSMQFDGTAKNINVTKLKGLQKAAKRAVSGKLSSSFSGKGSLQGPLKLECGGTFTLADGTLGLQQPVLGMKQIDYKIVNSSFHYDSMILTLADGSMTGVSLNGEFSGIVTPDESDIFRSSLQMQGSLTPRPELLASIGEPSVVNLLKQQLKGGKLPFRVNGTVREPGIVFAGLAADLNKQLQEGR